MSDFTGQSTPTCRNCGAQFPAVGARFCPVCGAVLGAAPAPIPTPPPAYQQPQGYGPVPGYSAGPVPARARRSSVPILAGLGAIALVLVIVAGALIVTGTVGSGSGASSPLATGGAASTGSTASAPGTTGAATPAPAGKYSYKDMVVGFIQTGSESGWRGANTTSFKETATADGITLKFYDSQNKIENQITALNQYIQDPAVNVIVLAAVSTTGYDTVLRAAKAAGKVVILEDVRATTDASLYFTYVGSDFEAEGKKAGTAMCDLLQGMSGSKVLEIAGDPASSAATDRGKGFRETMGGCGITIVASKATGWDPAVAKSAMAAYLKTSKDITGVFAHNDGLAVAAIQAIDAAGFKAGKDIKVVGFDATSDGFRALISGELGADIECSPNMAPQVFEAALKALNGETGVPKFIPTQEGVFFASQGPDALRAILATRKY